MKRIMTIVSLGICCLFAVAIAGCISSPMNPAQSPTPTGTPVVVGHLVVNESQNNTTVYMNQGSLLTVRLAENPTTGFQWNLTTSPGLIVVRDVYEPADTTGTVVGSGGTHVWDISAEMVGEQKINAVYKRSWEPITGNESTFSMTIGVS
jgi:inhibitor of cysteine peptidase